jgi:hypothetical protein
MSTVRRRADWLRAVQRMKRAMSVANASKPLW